MGILDQYKKAIESEEGNMDFPTDTTLTEEDKELYQATLKKMRNGDFSAKEVNEAIHNSEMNMKALGETSEHAIKFDMEKMSDKDLIENGLLKHTPITNIDVVRAYCPKCGKELISKTPAMYNPFSMQKVCMHECCGTKYNLDRTYPHIAFYDEDGNEINAFN